MSIELSIILFLSFIIIYVALINIFSILFRLTGLSRSKSRFQVISMLTCAGFTTKESEVFTKGKLRRRIAIACMITGNIFNVIIVSLIVNMFMNLKSGDLYDAYLFITIAFAIFLFIIVFFNIPVINRFVQKIFSNLAKSLLNKSHKDNSITILDVYDKQAIAEIYLKKVPLSLKHKSLADCNIKEYYDINIMMISRKGHLITVSKDTMFHEKDLVIVFGDEEHIKELFINNVDNDDKHLVIHHNEVELIDNYENEAMVEVTIIHVPEYIKDKPLFECNLKAIYNINVLIIKRDNKVIEVSKDTIIKENDKIIVFGNYQNIRYLFINSISNQTE